MKTILKIYLVACLFLFSGRVASAQVTVTITPVNQSGLEVFLLKDFDLTRPGASPPIFTLTITNVGQPRIGVRLKISLESQKFGELSTGSTRPFTLPTTTTTGPINLNNKELVGKYALENFHFREQLIKQLIQDILSTGRLPTDVYTFTAEIITGLGQSLSSDDFPIRVTNPRKLDLVFPGASAGGNISDCPKVFTRLPQFRWESDMRTFQVIVAEGKRGEDPESALNQEPRFVRNFIIRNNRTPGIVPDIREFRNRPDFLPATSFQFPASGHALRLRPGRVYYWRVIGFAETSSGRLPLKSEIYCFRIARLDNVTGEGQQVELILRNLLGSDYEKLFGEGGELEGFEAKRLTFEGKDAALPELMKRLPRLSRSFSGYRVE